MVVYGKTLGGGMPVGVVCGPSKLMNRNDPEKPLRVAYVIGTFSAAPLTVACMHQFLTWVESEDAEKVYAESRVLIRDWVKSTNALLEVSTTGVLLEGLAPSCTYPSFTPKHPPTASAVGSVSVCT